MSWNEKLFLTGSAKLTALIGADPADRLDTTVRDLAEATDAAAVLKTLNSLIDSPEGDHI